MAKGDTAQARDLLEDAVADEDSAAAHEALSEAAAALDDGRRAMAARACAFRLYREGGEDVAAARMALWLGKDHDEIMGAPAVAAGWRRRARSLLDGQLPAPENGWLPILECWIALRHHDECPRDRPPARRRSRRRREGLRRRQPRPARPGARRGRANTSNDQ
jgi:hypothetical protein